MNMTNLLAWQVGIWELLVILLVVLLLFGAQNIPKLMKGMGQGVGEFKKGLREGGDEPPKPPEAPKPPEPPAK